MNKQATQREKFQIELSKIKVDVTENDVRMCSQHSFSGKIYSLSTIRAYLAGNGNDNDTSFNLLAFFRKQIEKRNKILSPETVPA